MKLLLIEWDDVTSDNVSWVSKEDIGKDKFSKCITVGIIINDEPEYITVCLMLSPRCYSQTVTIPRGCIKRIRYLGVR